MAAEPAREEFLLARRHAEQPSSSKMLRAWSLSPPPKKCIYTRYLAVKGFSDRGNYNGDLFIEFKYLSEYAIKLVQLDGECGPLGDRY